MINIACGIFSGPELKQGKHVRIQGNIRENGSPDLIKLPVKDNMQLVLGVKLAIM